MTDSHAPHLLWAPPPASSIFRVSRGVDPFAPRPWDQAAEDGTFGNRFDDPGGLRGIPPERRYRAIYCATDRVAAFAEVVARLRPSVELLNKLGQIDDDEEPLEVLLEGVVDPDDAARGLISQEWRLKRRVGYIHLDPTLRFVDLCAPETMDTLRRELAPWLAENKISDVDVSALTSTNREFTQAVARYVYERGGDDGEPLYAGLRYVSRLNAAWQCWAIFDTRMKGGAGPPETIHPSDPGLIDAARIYHLTIEGPTRGHFIRP